MEYAHVLVRCPLSDMDLSRKLADVDPVLHDMIVREGAPAPWTGDDCL